jgi:hypothetical protein
LAWAEPNACFICSDVNIASSRDAVRDCGEACNAARRHVKQ